MNAHRSAVVTITSALALALVPPATLHGQGASPPPAQPPAAAAPRPATPNDTLVSPDVAADGRVRFRIYAPKAGEVTLRGDWMEAPGPVAMQKDDAGVWSLTVGPLAPDFYAYSMTVDGVRTLDPKNATIKQGISSVDNMVMVSGPASAFQEFHPVPHGEIRQLWYRSTTLERPRRVHVYVPPGYDQSTRRYPALYLLHGAGDEDSGWSTIGRSGFILDNLIAGGKAVPMIVVMPNGSMPRPPAPPGTPVPSGSVNASLQDRFVSELTKDVMPLVEKQYRIAAGREHRAIAGLSMGGGQTLRTIVTHPDLFAYAAIFSSGVNPQTTADFEQRSAGFLAAHDAVNKGYRVLTVMVGEKDFALEGARNLDAILTRHGIAHELKLTGGGHTWINWRQYLRDLAPQLFQKTPVP